MYFRSRGGFAGAIVSLLSLVVLGVPITHALNSPTPNLSWLAYALPITVVVIALVAASAGRLLRNGDAPVAVPARRGPAPGYGILLGLAGLGVGAWMMTSSERQARAYESDPSCKITYFVERTTSGACHVETATITNAHEGGGRSRGYYIGLSFGDGSTVNLQLGRELSGDVYDGARYRNDNAATVQFFGTHVVKVTTASGAALTSNMPSEQRNLWGLIGIGAGVLGIASALRATFS